MTIILETIYMKYLVDIPYLPLMDQYSIRDLFLDADLYYGIEAHAMANYVQKTDATIQSHGTP
jgi:hypothetical protein